MCGSSLVDPGTQSIFPTPPLGLNADILLPQSRGLSAVIHNINWFKWIRSGSNT